MSLYALQIYAALAASWAILKIWRLGQAFGRVRDPGQHHYAGLSEAVAIKRKESDAKLRDLLDEAVAIGAPIQVVVFVIAFIAVPLSAVLSLAWPYWLAKQLIKPRP